MIVTTASSRLSINRSTLPVSRARSFTASTVLPNHEPSRSIQQSTGSSSPSSDATMTRFCRLSEIQTLLDRASLATCRKRDTPRLLYISSRTSKLGLISLLNVGICRLRWKWPERWTGRMYGIDWPLLPSNRVTILYVHPPLKVVLDHLLQS